MTRLADIVAAFREAFFLPDPGIVYVTLAAVVANRLPGDPLWLVLVGPPSSGKSEVLATISGLSEVHRVSSFTEAGLLSGSPGKKGTGGLLMAISEFGLLVFSDLGTVLSEHSSSRSRLFALLREVYDGELTRQLGTERGHRFHWRGKVGLIGAATEAIDAVDVGLMGERLVYYRLPALSVEDEQATGLFALDNSGRQAAIRAHLRHIVLSFFAELRIPNEVAPLSGEEQQRLIDLATLGTRARSSVVRHGHSREIELVPQPERTPRFVAQLGQLHSAFRLLGVENDESWRLLSQVSLDGMHSGRRTVLEVLAGCSLDVTTSIITARSHLPRTTARRFLEELCAVGLVELTGDSPETWCLAEWASQIWDRLGLPLRVHPFTVVEGQSSEAL